MKKTAYNVAVAFKNMGGKRGVKAIPGYTFNFGGIRFGVSNITSNDVTLDEWIVTELYTGYAVATAATRKAAIDKAIRPDIIARIKATLATWNYDDINPGLTPDTDILTVHTN